jgi:hypothetical protein
MFRAAAALLLAAAALHGQNDLIAKIPCPAEEELRAFSGSSLPGADGVFPASVHESGDTLGLPSCR